MDRAALWRIVVLLLIWVLEVWLALYAGIGYTILIGYLVLIAFLVVPIKAEWLDSKFGRTVYGKISKPEIERFLREMSRSKSYRVTVAVTAVVLLAFSVLMITTFNYKLITLF